MLRLVKAQKGATQPGVSFAPSQATTGRDTCRESWDQRPWAPGLGQGRSQGQGQAWDSSPVTIVTIAGVHR